MQRIRIWIRGFFGFSRKETNAFLILLPLMIVILVSEPVYRRWKFRNADNNIFDRHYTDSVLATLKYPVKDSVKVLPGKESLIHFAAFDPNTASEKDLEKLGLSPFLANRIMRYREKGGSFKKKEDLLRIYGMDSSWFRKAKTWITLPEKTEQPIELKRTERTAKKPDLIDINTADSIQLEDVYGIGPGLSKRIRKYREKLGGFVSMEQLSEVYGLDTIVVKQVKKKFFLSPEFVPRRINLNATTLEELMAHPYIKRKEAHAILNYRNQHGHFGSIEDVLKIQIINATWLEKMRPYLSGIPSPD